MESAKLPPNANRSSYRNKKAKPVGFPVVGIGASAGGLETFRIFFEAMPADSGMAFVLVQHLDPTRESHTAELLARYTQMKVLQVKDGMRLEPNHVYVILPDRTLRLEKGVLRLSKPHEARGHRHPVDAFFRSLAEDQREKAIAIILSGTGSNGTAGAQDVKAKGGLVLAQEPETAKYDGMPKSVISAGVVDRILPPEKMPEILRQYVGHSYVKAGEKAEIHQIEEGDPLTKILALVSNRAHRDFRSYKKATLVRRIHRRMGIHQVEKLADYAKFLREHPEEIQALSKDLLIQVTRFFRDPEAWKTLEKKIASLLKKRERGSPVRVWVPACSTGEEAYSLAMTLIEQSESVNREFDIRIFATDTAENTLSRARAGLFPAAIANDLSPERLERFF